LENLARARAIRGAFFGIGNLQFRFAITPRFLDASATRAVLEIDQTRIIHAHDPPRTSEVTWPSGGEAFSLNFDVNGMIARYGLTGGSVVNPVDMRELQDFRCSPRL
jgi:type VI protein secretion system component VasK